MTGYKLLWPHRNGYLNQPTECASTEWLLGSKFPVNTKHVSCGVKLHPCFNAATFASSRQAGNGLTKKGKFPTEKGRLSSLISYDRKREHKANPNFCGLKGLEKQMKSGCLYSGRCFARVDLVPSQPRASHVAILHRFHNSQLSLLPTATTYCAI